MYWAVDLGEGVCPENTNVSYKLAIGRKREG
jgi:hypothetical protein